MNRGYADEQVRKSIVFYHGLTINVAAELKSIQQSLRGKHNLNIARQVREFVNAKKVTTVSKSFAQKH